MSSPRLAAALVLPLLLVVPAAHPAHAQSLRGSPAKVERAYRFAQSRGIAFTPTRSAVTNGVRDGAYVPLRPSGSMRLKGVALPYVRPATRSFVVALASRYRAACKAPLVVTSAIRPTAAQRLLRNGVEKSVHPTGMAVDLRAPVGSCRLWLRRELLAASRRGVVDATEERRPAHFHVTVFRAP